MHITLANLKRFLLGTTTKSKIKTPRYVAEFDYRLNRRTNRKWNDKLDVLNGGSVPFPYTESGGISLDG
jgi:hypothetical protein